MITCLVVIAALLVPAASAHGPWGVVHPRPPWLPKMWWAIGMCETHLNWQHHTQTYQGAFGFHENSYDAYRPPGAPAEAYLASPRQQYRAALNIYRRFGFSGWGCYTHGGYRLWLSKAP